MGHWEGLEVEACGVRLIVSFNVSIWGANHQWTIGWTAFLFNRRK
jgi:hypothetical protein